MIKKKNLNKKWKILSFLSIKNTTKIRNSTKTWLASTKVLMTYCSTFASWTLVAWAGMTELQNSSSTRRLHSAGIIMSSLNICFTQLIMLNWCLTKMIKMKLWFQHQNISRLSLIKMKRFIKMREIWKMIFKFYHHQFLPTNPLGKSQLFCMFCKILGNLM